MVRHHVRVGPLLWRFRRPRAGGDPAAFVEKSMDPCLCRDDGMAGVVQLLQWPDQCHSVIINSSIGAPFQPFVACKPRRCLCFVFGISQNLKILSPRRRPRPNLVSASIGYGNWIPACAGTTVFLEFPLLETSRNLKHSSSPAQQILQGLIFSWLAHSQPLESE